ncbi:hypothetical protein M433DRAFT_141214 [Acidomyces richmondensis BFW]|nr:MAG: hypothetical protein FE78DRAFT_75535 [Acidomyces sp. 'richmondensis']KYG48252.1 hypothetical protein M433DRAFT_141214 [Acidomyces richmondensis BFW]
MHRPPRHGDKAEQAKWMEGDGCYQRWQPSLRTYHQAKCTLGPMVCAQSSKLSYLDRASVRRRWM